MENNCLFCKIIAGQLPTTRLYENELLLAIPDLHPKAPVHVLILPKKHITDITCFTAKEAFLFFELFQNLAPIAKQLGLHDGFRTIINTGHGGGQTIFHLHMHLLGGAGLPEF